MRNSHKITLTAFLAMGLAGAVYTISYVLPALDATAAPPATTYTPGEQLYPTCVPGSTNCTVTPPAVSGPNMDITELTGLTTALSADQGGTGQSSYTVGDILAATSSSALGLLGVGTDGQILSADSAEATGLKWIDNSGGVSPDSLDFADFLDAMALDASTSIAVDNAEVLSISNQGTGNSLVVEDEASDTTPFVIDPSGNVGIKDDTPSYDLDVNGTVAGAVGRFTSMVLNGIAYAFPGTDGSDGQVLSTNGSGTLSWVDQGGSSGGGTPAAPVRFTRTGVSSSDDAAKDTQCANEFGSDYVAAQIEDALFYSGGVDGDNSSAFEFNVYGSTSYWEYENATEGLGLASTSGATRSVMCISKFAPIITTRTNLDRADSNTLKDSQCSTEYGSDFVAAIPTDLLYFGGNVYDINIEVVVADSTSRWNFISGVTDSSSVILDTDTSNTNAPVACINTSSGGGGGGGSVSADSLNFTEFSDTMGLDASTDIAITGSNQLSFSSSTTADGFLITNTASGNQSFRVDDTSGDSTPFVVDDSGNVGIKDSTPSQTLDVNGNTRVDGNLTVTGDVDAVTLDASGTVTFNGVDYSFPGSQGGTDQLLVNDGSGNLSWASPTVDQGGAAPAVDLRFTNGTIFRTDSNSNKDTLCASEFGDDFMAANLLEVMLHGQGGHSSEYFVVRGETANRYAYTAGTEGTTFTTDGTTTGILACIFKNATYRFTNSSYTRTDGGSTKDSNCQSEFGTQYNAGTAIELTSAVGGVYDNSLQIVLRDKTSNRWQVDQGTTNASAVEVESGDGTTTGPLFCIRQTDVRGVGFPGASIMYLQADGSAPSCPTGWTNIQSRSFDMRYSNSISYSDNMRVCYRDDKQCQVVNLISGSNDNVACSTIGAGDWEEAANSSVDTTGGSGGSNYIRTCFKCY